MSMRPPISPSPPPDEPHPNRLSTGHNDNESSYAKSTTPLSSGNDELEMQEVPENEPQPEPPAPAPAPPALPPMPEGGFRAWATTTGGLMIMWVTFGAVQSFGVYQDFYTRQYLANHTPSEVAWIGSTQVFFLFAIGLPAGKAFDEGYFHYCIGLGTILYLFSSFLLSLAHESSYYQIYLAQGVGMGIAMGMMFLPSLSVTSHYFRKRRSVAMGVVICGSSLGAITYPILLNNLFNKEGAGFGWGVRAASFLDLALLLAANLMMRTRLPSRKNRPNQKPVDIHGILTDWEYWICVAGAFMVFWGLFIPFFYLQLFADLHGVRHDLTIYSISILNTASFFGRTIPNFAADKFGPFNIMLPFTALSCGLIFAMLGASHVGGMVIFALLYGFFSGGYITLIVPAAASFARDLNELGTRIGVMSFVCAFALLTGNPIAGGLLGEETIGGLTWWKPLLFACITVAIGTVLLAIARSRLVKRRGSNRV